MGPLYHWNDNNRSSERLIVNTRLMNVFEQRFLIITFISKMIQIHRDLKWIKIHLLTTKSSNNYEMFNMHKVSSVQKRTEKKSICSGCERWRKITLSKYSTTATTILLYSTTTTPTTTTILLHSLLLLLLLLLNSIVFPQKIDVKYDV